MSNKRYNRKPQQCRRISELQDKSFEALQTKDEEEGGRRKVGEWGESKIRKLENSIKDLWKLTIERQSVHVFGSS